MQWCAGLGDIPILVNTAATNTRVVVVDSVPMTDIAFWLYRFHILILLFIQMFRERKRMLKIWATFQKFSVGNTVYATNSH